MSASHSEQLSKSEVKPLLANKASKVALLRQEAQGNPAFKTICQVFTQRQRTRNQVMMGTLQATLEKQGFTHPKEKLSSALAFLANLGFGRLERNSKGNVTGLKDIRITLQSIGRAALSESNDLEVAIPKQLYKPLVNDGTGPKKNKIIIREPERFSIALTAVNKDGKTISFPLPMKLTAKELGTLVVEMYGEKVR